MNDEFIFKVVEEDDQHDLDYKPNDFWIIVALDYNMENAWLMDYSPDFSYVEGLDYINGSNIMDSSGIGGQDEWVKDAVPGLWKLWLKGWSYQDYQGDWDSGWDILDTEGYKPKLLVAFPEGGL